MSGLRVLNLPAFDSPAYPRVDGGALKPLQENVDFDTSLVRTFLDHGLEAGILTNFLRVIDHDKIFGGDVRHSCSPRIAIHDYLAYLPEF